MRRKLVQMGKHTLMAAIPSSWIQRHSLKKGDSIEFIEFENKLVLTSTAEIFERRTTIKIASPKIEVVWRVLQPTYTSGYDEVLVYYDDSKTLSVIESIMQQLIGFEIVETKEGFARIKSISAQLDEELPTVLSRVWSIILTMVNTYQECITSKRSRLSEIHTLEWTINKYTMFLKRVMNRTGYKYPQYTYQIVAFLELAANHLEYLRRYFEMHPKTKIEKETLIEGKRLVDLFQRVRNLYIKYSEEEFRWIAEEQPHFNWFLNIKDPVVRMNYTSMAEYLVQIARQIQALHT